MDQPYDVALEANKKYCWCQCGYTQTPPFCDGSHKTADTPLKSLHFYPEKTEVRQICGCRKTQTPPYCDGTHNTL